MRKFIVVVLVAASLAATPTAEARPKEQGPCSEWRYRHIIPSLGISEVQRRVKVLIRCAVRKWPVSLSTAFYVANRESRYYCWAVNPSGSTGVYQIISSTYAAWRAAFPEVAAYTIDSRFNCRSNVLLSIRAAYAYGWGAWGM